MDRALSIKALLAGLGLLVFAAWAAPWKAKPSASAEDEPTGADKSVTVHAEQKGFPNKAQLRYAKMFKVDYRESYKVVTVSPGHNKHDPTFQYLLVPRGTRAPDGYPEARVVEVPVRSVVPMSSSQLGFIDALGLADKVIGVDELDHVNTRSIRERIAAGKVVEIGHDKTVNMEVLLNLNPDLVMVYWTGIPEHEIHPKLMGTGIPVAINVEYLEPSPLGRAEWLKFLALFFNLEGKAKQLFSKTAREYLRLCELARRVKHRPTVFTGSNHRGTWYMGGGNSHFANLLRDAGAEYLWSDNDSTGVRTLDFEAVFERALNADFWVNAGIFKSLDEIRSADVRHASFAAFKGGRVYNNNARLNEHGFNDYWESGTANPDQVLADLISIFHPDRLPEHERIWYRKLESSGTVQKN